MSKMHTEELEISLTLVKKLIKDQCPKYCSLPLKPIKTTGTTHALFRLGSEYLIRLPRLEESSVNIEKENEFLPQFEKFLSIPISIPIFKGNPNNDYPCNWMIVKWQEGKIADFDEETEFFDLAKDLALFINELHSIEVNNGPLSRRGIPLNSKDLQHQVKSAIEKLKDELNINEIKNLWEELSNIPYWDKKPVWIHGDLLPGNILVKDKRLSAVIDFSDLGIGDPACDLIPAWCIFNSQSRNHFKKHLLNVDESTWQRSRGWALCIGLIILPYYKHTNPSLVNVAKKMIDQVINSF